MLNKFFTVLFLVIIVAETSVSQNQTNQNIFRQLSEELPTPNSFRTASGRPGPDYFQQQVDYIMDITLDEDENYIYGSGTIIYHNNSPETLSYLWLQLDQNVREKNSFGSKISTSAMSPRESMSRIMRMNDNFDGGFIIESLTDNKGNSLHTVKNYTIMKVILSEPVEPGKTTILELKWHYRINNLKKHWGRSGYEPFEEKGNSIYAIAQFYPRLCVFNDNGWQTKQFVTAEFALEFGNFDVTINVPSDHIVAATGELQNSTDILSPAILKRLEQARKSDTPIFIVTEEEAKNNEAGKSSTTSKWHFKARNVRDFAFASSRKFIWDAMNVTIGINNIMAMSFYPAEANPLWSRYSTKVIAHTLRVFSQYTFDYPYPVAQSVDASLGMEYPMIGFNGGRPDPDGSYSERTRNQMIGIIRHEVGHNFFPMIVNSDEREWQWMDEGFIIFLQGIAKRVWDIDQDWSGIPTEIVDYMRSDKNNRVPIMTSADALLQAGMNSYRKPAVGLTILRETILGRELFDRAFKEYARTWKFKHPQPADFFRLMEDASGVDLSWFWRGWFFTTEHVDMAIENVRLYLPVYDEKSARKAAEYNEKMSVEHPAVTRDRGTFITEIDRDPELRDIYHAPQPLISDTRLNEIKSLKKRLAPEEMEILEQDLYYYEIEFKSHGGMIMPLILLFKFVDGSSKEIRIPAEIWIRNQEEVTKVFVFDNEIESIILDPYLETTDVNMNNNHWPRKTEVIYFDLIK